MIIPTKVQATKVMIHILEILFCIQLYETKQDFFYHVGWLLISYSWLCQLCSPLPPPESHC